VRRFFSTLAKKFGQTRKAGSPKAATRRAALQIEALETRELLSGSPLPAVRPPVKPLLDPIHVKYESLGGRNGFMGPEVTGEMPTPYGGGIYDLFAGGAIFWSPSTGAHYFENGFLSKWDQTELEHGANGEVVQKILGLPTADETKVPGTTADLVVQFQGGEIYHTPAGAHVLYGAIAAEYAATAKEIGGNGQVVQKILGAPTSDEMNVPGVPGARMNTFQGGAIYWSPSTGAHVVYGAIYSKYNSLGGPAAYGLPVIDEVNAAVLPGVRVSNFQGGRSIYWSSATGAHAVYGAIGSEFIFVSSEKDFYGRNVMTLLGAPTSDEMNVPGVPGARMNTFQGGTIYWSPSTGAHVVYGAIAAKYNSIGGAASSLGLPISDELNLTGAVGRVSLFQHGRIVWTPAGGAVVQ
jgi:uncharacterized protein with LGFP repeats